VGKVTSSGREGKKTIGGESPTGMASHSGGCAHNKHGRTKIGDLPTNRGVESWNKSLAARINCKRYKSTKINLALKGEQFLIDVPQDILLRKGMI